MTLDSRWAADPTFNYVSFPLGEFTSQYQLNDNAVEIPLSIWMGDQIYGSYRLTLTGPNNSRTEFRFRVWPELEIEGLRPYYMPTTNGAENAEFTLSVPPNCQVQAQAGVEGVSIHPTQNSFDITVSPEQAVVDLLLIASRKNSEPIRAPLSLAIPRLRWSFLESHESTEFAWHESPISSNVSAFLQADHPALYLDLPLVDELPSIFNIHLVNPETGESLQEHIRPQEIHFRQTRWHFPLGEFSDMLRYMEDQPIFEFQLVISDVNTGDQKKIPLIRLSRILDIRMVWIEHLEPPNFCLKWVEPKPLRNRRVRIWSEWQPWIQPIEINIPDDAQGEVLVSDVALPPSQYRLHFFTAAPWDPPNPPPTAPSDSLLLETTSARERLSSIRQRIEANPSPSFVYHFERVCILNSTGDQPKRDDEITWCYQNLNQATPDQILAIYRWLGPHDPASQRAVRIRMYSPDHLNRLYEIYPHPNHNRDSYLEHFQLTTLINPESGNLILKHENNPAIVMHALIVLMKRDNENALPHIFSHIESGQLSDHDGTELLALNPDFSLPELSKVTDSPHKARLIQSVVKNMPEQCVFATKNFWMRTNAGWGRIDSIQIGSNNDLLYFDRRLEKPFLNITLRPDEDPEEVHVDLSTSEVTFLNAEEVFICTKEGCYYFASADENHIKRTHNSASHMGIGPAYRPYPATFEMNREILYSLNPPENQFE